MPFAVLSLIICNMRHEIGPLEMRYRPDPVASIPEYQGVRIGFGELRPQMIRPLGGSPCGQVDHRLMASMPRSSRHGSSSMVPEELPRADPMA